MIIREKQIGYIDELRHAYTDEMVLMRVSAYDPRTKMPCYGEVLAFNKSRLVVDEIRERFYQARNSNYKLELFIFQGSAHLNGTR